MEVMTDKDQGNSEAQNNEQLQEALQEEYLKSLNELEEGQLIEGSVIEVTPETVFIDIGYKSEGKIPTEEFDDKPEIGDTVNVVLISKEGRSGDVVVSKRKADEKVFWKDLKEAFEEHKPVKGRVIKSIKGGYTVSLSHGVNAFNPISKMDLHRIENPEEYVGLESNFFIERLYSNNKVNIVLSRRDWLDDQIEERKNRFFEDTKIGDTVEGKVKSFTSFGSFIDLGGFDGLLHINDMSWGHVTRPKDYVKKNQKIKLKVIRLDPEDQKINLSLKHFSEDPWLSFEEKYDVDDVVKGTVTKLTDFGAFIELEEGIEGLAHISELSWVKRIKHPKEILSVGDEVEVKILDYDVQAGKVSLGVKQVLPNPWEELDEKYPIGMRLTRPVKKITNSGAFIELEEGMDGFLHVDDISWTQKYRNPGEALKEGEEYEVIVTDIDPQNHNIRLGIKQLSEDPWSSLKKAYPEHSIIEGEITNITDFGVFVRVQGGIEGLINKSNLSNPKEMSFEEAVKQYNVGDHVTAVITEINPGRQKLSLSIRELERKQRRAELQKYIHDDDESTFTLGDMLMDSESDEGESE